ncbi:MAG: alpha-hydroxy acid oxidase [Boseongicola sp.]
MPSTPSRIFSTEDARRLAKRRLPRLVFDFIEGAAGREVGLARNELRFDEICLQPRVMADVSERSLATELLGRNFDVPFGMAPMGMCNLVCRDADRLLAEAATRIGMPLCISSAASTSMEEIYGFAGKNAWFQLYFRQSEAQSLAVTERAHEAGYETLVLTVDVPQVSRRIRDQRNGFNWPFHMTPRAFFDFATHPRWSLSTLASGIPRPRNFGGGDGGFDRRASRAGADWNFLTKLRDKWAGRLIVKGVTSAEDAVRVRDAGADAIYVSNHGARQLDSAPAAIDLLPLIRQAVGPKLPLLFDSGIRNGEDVVKALALGADFVMIGRPALFALAAEGRPGLNALLQCFVEDMDIAMAQLGANSIKDIGPQVLFDCAEGRNGGMNTARPAKLQIAAKT